MEIQRTIKSANWLQTAGAAAPVPLQKVQGHERAWGFIPCFPRGLNSSSRRPVAREKGLVLGMGRKRQPGATQTFLWLFLQPERKEKNPGVFMCLPLWGGRKVNYQPNNQLPLFNG